MDDYPVIVNNLDIRSISNFIANTFPGRPLREITYLFDYALFGLDPWGYHFQNIFWHALGCWLVYCIAIKLNLGNTVAWLSSLLFLVHPIHVEVVANSSHRKDSLALVFLLMALLSYMKIFENQLMLRRMIWLTTSLLLWITAFFAKGNSLVFPAIMMAYEYALVPAENRLIVRWKRMFPFLCISSAIGLFVWYFYIATLPSFKIAIMGAFIKTENLASFSVSAYILMLLKSFAFMFSKLILPFNLSMEYIYAVPGSISDPWVVMALAIISVCLVMAYRWHKTSPQHFFLLLFTAIFWLPTSNIFWYFSYFAADRYMYAPSAGLCILAVLVTTQIMPTVRRYLVIGWTLVLSFFAVLTWQQTAVWHNQMNLYSHILKISPRSLEGMVGLSREYYLLGNYDLAVLYAQKAIERDWTDFRPYIALGSAYDELGNTSLAIEAFKTGLKFRPDHFMAYTNLGVVYERENNLPEAESALNKAISLNRSYSPAWYNLGVVRYRNHDKQGAKRAFLEAANCDPSNYDALTNLAIVCKETGDRVCHDEAISRKAKIVPDAADKFRQRLSLPF